MSQQYRYHDITFVSCIWSHLKHLKCGGVSQQLGIDVIPDGGLTVECPACPHPRRNTAELSGREL